MIEEEARTGIVPPISTVLGIPQLLIHDYADLW